jgi:CheY-like chemotaxis protein/two-component sensor histidine kinase
MMERQLTHLVRLVDDLLDLSRITRGKVELQRRTVDLRDVVASAVETSRPLIEGARHQLVVDLPEGPLPLDADPMRLAQVFANLLNNAAKYTPAGGRIQLQAQALPDGRVEVCVRDDGIGIPAEKLPDGCARFTQIGRSVDRALGGLGIGLTLVKSLLEMHGGTVRAESAGPGQGSVFRLALPLADSVPAARTEAGAPRSAATSRSLGVLVVDDNLDGAESLAMLLNMGGHSARSVHDGPSALQAVDELAPDVVFLDIGLPGMSGYEVARRLRARPALHGTTIVALTGWGAEEDRRRSREAGFDHHLTTPVDPAAVDAVLEEAAARRAR